MRPGCSVLQWGRGRSSSEIGGSRAMAPTSSMLQWGRGRSSSEIWADSPTPQSLAELQWGRGRSSSEIGSRTRAANIRSWLQWGRGRSSSEMRSVHSPTPRRSCFNGAEDDRPRRCVRAVELAPLDRGLQWGRGRSSSEIRTISLDQRTVVTASMGPRTIVLGDRWAICGCTMHSLELQWGRGRSSSEIRAVRHRPEQWAGFNGAEDDRPRRLMVARKDRCTSGPLQWGRGRSSSEICVYRNLPVLRVRASMGPRTIVLGDLVFVGVVGNRLTSFNGAEDDRPRR